MDKALLWIALAMCASACPSGEPERKVVATAAEATPPKAEDGRPPEDAGNTPSSDDAALVLRTFAEKLLKDDLPGARQELHIPEQFRDKQVNYFLQELQAPENLTMAGVDQVMQAEFGPLAERFGSEAAHVASKLGLSVASLYAFGDTQAAALLHWDGKRFWVAAVHQLAARP